MWRTFYCYVTLNLTFLRPPSPVVTVCHGHFRPPSYRYVTDLRYPPPFHSSTLHPSINSNIISFFKVSQNYVRRLPSLLMTLIYSRQRQLGSINTMIVPYQKQSTKQEKNKGNFHIHRPIQSLVKYLRSSF